jgi:hypothetical protein
MIRQIIFIIILLSVCLSSPVLAVGKGPAYRFLKEPAVKWTDARLTGEVKNAPVISLITELLQKAGSNWEVIGNLEGSISISFDNLTINDSIKKIMRLNHFNYALIFDERQPQDSKSSHLIKELTIYQGNQRIRFSRTAKQAPAPGKKNFKEVRKPVTGKIAAAWPAKPPAEKSKIPNTQRPEPTEEEMTQIDKELRAFADEMLAEKKITLKEYKELIGELETPIHGAAANGGN